MTYTFPTVNEALPALASAVLAGEEVGSRNGRTRELVHAHVKLTDPTAREILLPSRRANLAAQIAETVWVLAGRNDIGWLSRYLPRARDFSDDGETWRGGYGPRIRAWRGHTDQLAAVVDLLRADPATRRAVIQIYDPSVDGDPTALDLPCNLNIHFLSRLGYLHAQVTVRSNDLWWGWSGINAFEWSALLEIVAKMTGMRVGHLTFATSSLHLYDRHWDRAEKLAAAPLAPRVELERSPAFAGGRDTEVSDLDETLQRWFEAEAEIRDGHPAAAAEFEEPMLRSWLQVLAWYWTGDAEHLEPLRGTRLHAAAEASYRPEAAAALPRRETFLAYVSRLHADKHAAYGDSWKRRGEVLGILANVARKVDRLGAAGAGETAADTAIDLLVYLAKYRWWLVEHEEVFRPYGCGWHPHPTDHVEPVEGLLASVAATNPTRSLPTVLEKHLVDDFAELEKMPPAHERAVIVDHMLPLAYELAAKLWWIEGNAARRWKGYEG